MAKKYYPKKRKTYYKRKSRRHSEDNLFTGTDKLAKTAIKAYEKGGMPLVLVIIGLIGFILTLFLKSILETSTFVIAIIVEVLLFLGGLFLYCKEKKIF